MDVIANNVSNVNTVGFKGSRTLFQDVFSQTISSASGASEATGRGGVNAMQIGLGAGVAAIDRMMTPGAMQRTDHAFDLTVIGSGFFIVGDESGTFFTRNGAVRMDDQSNLLYTNGMRLMGWRVAQPWDTGGSVEPGTVERGPVVPIEIETDMRTAPPHATNHINFSGNLVPDPTAGITTMFKHFHDSLGNRHSLTVEKQLNPVTGAWDVSILHPDPDEDDPIGTLTLQFNVNGRLNVAGPAPGVDGSITDGVNTEVVGNADGTAADPHLNQVEFTLPNDVIEFLLGDGADAQFGTNGDGVLLMSFGDLTQFGNIRGNATATDMNGMPAGELTNLSVGQDGQVMALYSNGAMRAL
jgi:flagellar hook protein FlgE